LKYNQHLLEAAKKKLLDVRKETTARTAKEETKKVPRPLEKITDEQLKEMKQ
jgi:hypothetical protein